jgi:glycerol kinase
MTQDPSEKKILVLDAGTTYIKAFLFDRKGNIVAEVRKRTSYILDEQGQVEQSPAEMFDLSLDAISELLSGNGLGAADIAAMGITTQRSTFLFWDKVTGKPYCRLITWQDRRAADLARQVTGKLWLRVLRRVSRFLSLFIKSTRLVLYSILKFDTVHSSVRAGYWLAAHPEEAAEFSRPGTDTAFGTLDSWLLWNLTGGAVHATDYSSASSTGLLDPFTLKWNTIVLKLFKIPVHILPEIRETGADFGTTTLFGTPGIPIRALFADQQASLFGQGCFRKGDMKCTNGTGSFIDLNTGEKPYASVRQLYPLVAWKWRGSVRYMLEGQSQNTGNIITWLQEELKLIVSPEETETLARECETTDGVYFVPAFSTGLSFPWWDPTTRGNIFGLSLRTGRKHIVRAVLEGIGFRIKDIVDGILADTRIKVTGIRMDGGVSRNHFLLEFISDMTGLPVRHYANPEFTALGTAFMAGLECGYWSSLETIESLLVLESTFHPRISEGVRVARYRDWRNVIRRSLKFNLK